MYVVVRHLRVDGSNVKISFNKVITIYVPLYP